MSAIDTLCLWVGYCVCALALVRALIDSIFATRRCYRRAVRWIFKANPMLFDAALSSAHQCKFNPTGQWSDKGVGIEGKCRCGKTINLPC